MKRKDDAYGTYPAVREILKDGMYSVESEGGDNWRILHGDTLKLVKAFQPGTLMQ